MTSSADWAFWTDRRRTGDVIWIALVIVFAVGGLTATFHNPTLAAVVMGAVLAFELWRWHEPQDWLLALSGMVCGGILEAGATATGTWTYAFPSIGGLPIWVFTLWPAYPLALVRLSRALLPRGQSDLAGSRDLLIGVLVVGVEIPLLCAFGTEHGWPVAAATALMMAAAAWSARVPHTALMLAVSGLVGPFCEYPLIYTGAWSYPAPAFVGLPAWLPTGYALFGMGVVHIALGLEKLAPAWMARFSRTPSTVLAPDA